MPRIAPFVISYSDKTPWCCGCTTSTVCEFRGMQCKCSANVVQVRSHVQPVKLALLLVLQNCKTIRQHANLIQYARSLPRAETSFESLTHPRALSLSRRTFTQFTKLVLQCRNLCLVWNARAPAPFTWNFPMLHSRWVTSRPTWAVA